MIFWLSPLLVVCILSLVSLVVGLQRYRLRQDGSDGDLDERTSAFIVLGTFGLPVSGSMILVALTSSRMVLLVLLLAGLLLFSGGALTLRSLVIAGKAYVFSAVITVTSFVS
ncbi:MAG: hypothetical protein ABI456_11595 [Ktedonobacteraceae bacterium]